MQMKHLPFNLPHALCVIVLSFFGDHHTGEVHKFFFPTSFLAKPFLHPLGLVCFQIAFCTLEFCSGHTPMMIWGTMALQAFFNPASHLLHFSLLCHMGQKTHCPSSPHSPNDCCHLSFFHAECHLSFSSLLPLLVGAQFSMCTLAQQLWLEPQHTRLCGVLAFLSLHMASPLSFLISAGSDV